MPADDRPELLQRLDAARLRAASPLASSWATAALAAEDFGSWSPICERIVPKIMAVEAAWKHVRFEYYGLPQPLTDDPYAVDQHITGVPTVVVLRGGVEIDRLTGRQLDAPDEAIGRVLSGN